MKKSVGDGRREWDGGCGGDSGGVGECGVEEGEGECECEEGEEEEEP